MLMCICLGSLFSNAGLGSDQIIPTATNLHHPEEFIKSIANDPQAGKKIYEQLCSTCHARDPSIELEAPKIGVTKDWARLMPAGINNPKSIESLLTLTIMGVNQMPPRGGCFECSNEQLKAAIIYMLPKPPKPK